MAPWVSCDLSTFCESLTVLLMPFDITKQCVVDQHIVSLDVRTDELNCEGLEMAVT